MRSKADQNRMMLDVTVINQKLGSIAEAGKNLTSLQMLVKDKPVPRKNVSQTMAGLLKRNGSKKDTPEDSEAEKDAEAETREEGDGDEDGESLGIIPMEDEKKGDEPVPPPTETPAEQSDSTQLQPPALPEKSDDVGTTEQPPTTPPKDTISIRPSSEEVSAEPTAQEEAVTDEVLTAPPTKEAELPVAHLEPLDAEKEKPSEEASSGTAPTPPPISAPPRDDREPVDVEEEKPALPEKE